MYLLPPGPTQKSESVFIIKNEPRKTLQLTNNKFIATFNVGAGKKDTFVSEPPFPKYLLQMLLLVVKIVLF